MQIVSSVAAMQRLAKKWRRAGIKIGFVPTMGYLHAGHLSLVRERAQTRWQKWQSRREHLCEPDAICADGGFVEISARFETRFENVPRGRRGCRFHARRCGNVSGVGHNAESAQPQSAIFSTYVVEEKLSRTMEGASRPTHFRGVTTVVAKLFNIVLPDVSVFGQKDFQQAAVIRRMVVDLNFPVKIIVAPTLREKDGLAMSSRNKYLDAEQRAQAVIFFHALQAAKEAVKKKSVSAARLKTDLQEFITAAPLAKLDYVEFFDPETLEPVTQVNRGTQMALAVFFGKTRLIDNSRL